MRAPTAYRRILSATALAGSALLLTACTESADTTADTTSTATETTAETVEETTTVEASSDAFTVVASTSVWGDVASAVITDPNADIQAIVQGTNVDPHSFEPAARDLADAEAADLVVANGGGYDAWLYEAIDQDKIVHPLPLVEGHDHSHDHDHGHDHAHEEGHDHEHDHAHEDHAHEDEHAHDHDHSHDLEGGVVDTIDGNEHVWFDVDAVAIVADMIATEAQEMAPGIEADASDVVAEMDTLRQRLEDLPTFTVAQTETIGDYIIEDAGLTDVTPEGYRHAQLNHNETTASDLAAFLATIDNGEVNVLLYNPQTQTDTQEQIRSAAEAAGVQIVEIGETPPEGTDFLDYFHEVIDALEAAAAAANE